MTTAIAAANQMIKQGNGGRIINAASIVSYRPFATLTPYSASKWAIRGFTQGAAMEWACHGIRVTGASSSPWRVGVQSSPWRYSIRAWRCR